MIPEEKENQNESTAPKKQKQEKFIMCAIIAAVSILLLVITLIFLGINMINLQTNELKTSEFNDYFYAEKIQSMYSRQIVGNNGQYEVTGEYVNDKGETKKYKVILIEAELVEYINEIKNNYPDVIYEAGR